MGTSQVSNSSTLPSQTTVPCACTHTLVHMHPVLNVHNQQARTEVQEEICKHASKSSREVWQYLHRYHQRPPARFVLTYGLQDGGVLVRTNVDGPS